MLLYPYAPGEEPHMPGALPLRCTVRAIADDAVELELRTFHVYDGLSHGFGIGIGTAAEGWVNDAIKFWKDNMKTTNTSGIPPVEVV